LASLRLLFLTLKVCRPSINLPGVLEHINSTSQAFYFIHALTQSIFALCQVLQAKNRGEMQIENAGVSAASEKKFK
jgi:hypothetical protein